MLFSEIIFGPVNSRRLGISLGVNLLPTESKICNFDCIYCECGWNSENRGVGGFVQRGEVAKALELKLREMTTPPDVITFAGNGEPTLHPKFAEIVEDTLAIRAKYAPEARVAVLSNATMLQCEGVRRALMSVDDNILKLDAGDDAIVQLINRPQSSEYSVGGVVEQLQSFGGKCTVQTLFLRGVEQGVHFDNTSGENLSKWLEIIGKISPREVMIYSLDRQPPSSTIERVERPELERIAALVEQLGIKCQIA